MLSTFRRKCRQVQLGLIMLILVCGSNLVAHASELPDKQDNAKAAESPDNNEVNEPQEKIEPGFSGGQGTAKKPYLIASKKDLLDLAEELSKEYGKYRESHYKLTKDINLGSTEWIPMCHDMAPFLGVFDGNGHRITIKKIAGRNNAGLFSSIDTKGIVKNLIVKSSINGKITTKGGLNFGLIAGRSGGTIINCTTEGTIKLTVNAAQDINIGGVVGRLEGKVHDIENNASITVNKTGAPFLLCGGIAGMGQKNTTLMNISNNGNITVTTEGQSIVGGIVGQFLNGDKIYNVLNNGDVFVSVKITGRSSASAGGITGLIFDSSIDRAINKKKIYIENTGKPDDEEVYAGGIAGSSRNTKYTNVGNEGSIECDSGRVGIAAGIKVGGDTNDSIINAYNTGSIYAHTKYTNDSKKKLYYDVYAQGLVGGSLTEAKNFYNSGTITKKQGNKKAENGEAFANIRPGENTKTFNYCYWSSDIDPFPPLQKGTNTTSSFNKSSGKLAKSFSIGNKSRSNITDALNAWINAQKNKKDYVTWSGKGTPKFTETFGYKAD